MSAYDDVDGVPAFEPVGPGSAYADDDRVAPYGNGFTVTIETGDTVHVVHTETFGWAVCHGPNLDFVLTDSGPAFGIASADDAIHALIGDPQ